MKFGLRYCNTGRYVDPAKAVELVQAKHTYATLALIEGESRAIVARNLGISLATLEKHYASALQQGRLVRPPQRSARRWKPHENPTERSSGEIPQRNPERETGIEPLVSH